MKLRYADCSKHTFEASTFNTSACFPDEVLTGDDSAFVTELEVFVCGRWKSLVQAFRDHDVVTDNHNRYFFEPKNAGDKKRGFTLA